MAALSPATPKPAVTAVLGAIIRSWSCRRPRLPRLGKGEDVAALLRGDVGQGQDAADGAETQGGVQEPGRARQHLEVRANVLNDLAHLHHVAAAVLHPGDVPVLGQLDDHSAVMSIPVFAGKL